MNQDFVTGFLVRPTSVSLQSPHLLSEFVRETCCMNASAATAVTVLVADSNRMQAQLLTRALRRHAEFDIAACEMDTASILEAVASKLPHVALLSMNASAGISETVMTLRHFHLSYPGIAKVLLVEGCDRELVVSAFRSGARGIFSISDANLRLLVQMSASRRCRADLGEYRTTQLCNGFGLRSSIVSACSIPAEPAAHSSRGAGRRPGCRRTRQPSDRP